MSLLRTAAIARRILQGFRHDRRTLVLLFVAPLIILGLFYFLIRGGSEVPSVDVVNLDQGGLGTVLASHLQASAQIAVSATDLDQARSDLSSDRVAAYILLPSNLTATVSEGGTAAPEVHLEGTQPGLTQPVLAALDQSEASLLGSIGAQGGVHLPTLRPTSPTSTAARGSTPSTTSGAPSWGWWSSCWCSWSPSSPSSASAARARWSG